MQFSVATLAFFVNLALSAAVPDAAPVGMVQKLDTRDVSENLIFGRSFPCASNDPTTCCAVSHFVLFLPIIESAGAIVPSPLP